MKNNGEINNKIIPSILNVPLPEDNKKEYEILRKLVEKEELSNEEEKKVEDMSNQLINKLREHEEQKSILYAVHLIKNGFETRKIFQIIGWKGFEKVTAILLESLDANVFSNFRFKTILGEKREIDILAFRRPIVLSIDCKNWLRKGSHTYGLRQAAKQQKQRTLELFDIFPEISAYTPLKYWKKAFLIPLVVSSLDHDLIVENDVLIVPLSGLGKLINEILSHEELFSLKWENGFYY